MRLCCRRKRTRRSRSGGRQRFGTGDAAWILESAALVLCVIPRLSSCHWHGALQERAGHVAAQRLSDRTRWLHHRLWRDDSQFLRWLQSQLAPKVWKKKCATVENASSSSVSSRCRGGLIRLKGSSCSRSSFVTHLTGNRVGGPAIHSVDPR